MKIGSFEIRNFRGLESENIYLSFTEFPGDFFSNVIIDSKSRENSVLGCGGCFLKNGFLHDPWISAGSGDEMFVYYEGSHQFFS